MRPAWRLWLIVYIGCGLVMLAGLAVGAYAILDLEAEEARVRAERELDRQVRLTLAELDRIVEPLYDWENRRAPREYEAFSRVPRTSVNVLTSFEAVQPIAPSPLLLAALGQPARPGDDDPFVRLHFETDDVFAEVRAPTTPEGPDVDRLDRLIATLEAETGRPRPEFRAALEPYDERLGEVREIVGGRGVAFADNRLEEEILGGFVTTPELSGAPRADAPAPTWAQLRRAAANDPTYGAFIEELARLDPALRAAGERIGADTDEDLRRLAESMARATPAERTAAAAAYRGRIRPGPARPARPGEEPREVVLSSDGSRMEIGPARFVWRSDPSGELQLFLLREVTEDRWRRVQAVWFDWSRLRARLLDVSRELLPGSRLEPVLGADRDPGLERLRRLPLELRPPLREPRSFWLEGDMTPTRWAIVTMFATVVGAYLAVGLALQGSAQLAARRGRFVSAVTHELRTPMTTFQLYTELLADGLIRDEQKKREYLSTLKTESARLGQIVENVLTYARLRPGRPRSRVTTGVGVDDLLNRIEGPLRRRAEQEGMTLTLDAPARDRALKADGATVERILVNLVDNAAKYAGGEQGAEDRRIHLEVSAHGRWVRFAVGDHGPGVPPADRARIFDAFRRGRRKADTAKSGLGLGLALSRGLARDMGGRLWLASAGRGPLPECSGAVFVLDVPAAHSK